jgi:acyl-coenzyme A thioesterase PaaI-like protein
MSRLSQFVEKWLAGDLELAPITQFLGVRPVSLGEGEARIELTAGKHLHNAMGTVHAASSATSPMWPWEPLSPPSLPKARPSRRFSFT